MIYRYFILCSLFLLISFNMEAKTVQQFFIKISPSNNLVKYGKINVKKYNTTFDYHTKGNHIDLAMPHDALLWIFSMIHKKNQDKSSKVLLFLHGFWGSTPYSAYYTTKKFNDYYFKNDSSGIVAIVHIIWNASGVTYKQSIRALDKSTKTLAEILNNIPLTFECKYSLMCHSMGNRFLFETISKFDVDTKFDELILMAPDLDYRKYENNTSLFSKLASNIYIFIHTEDHTLFLSKTYNKVERLGRMDKYKNRENIFFVNCTTIDDINNLLDKFNRHVYFLSSETVRSKVEEILK